jgi:hypothetical protein
VKETQKGGTVMKKGLIVSIPVLFILGFFVSPVLAQNTLVRFEGGIGVIPVSAGPAANVVRGVNPGGQPWVIKELDARVRTNGDIGVDGEGLLLAGGNNIGTNGNQSVVATLFCGTQAFSTSPGVPLEPNGDFRIRDRLEPLPLPGICESPVLLIRSFNPQTGPGNWFAAGIPKLD